MLITGFAIAALAVPARAQSMDYGALEELFDEPVTTSVTGSPQRASDVPASMTIITQDEIRRSGARDIPGVLRHVPGLDILQWTNDQADVAVRGYNQAFSPRLLVLVNGRQVYADFYGYTPWSTLPIELSDIRQIEVVSGPNGALFGFNAVGGVINIVTYDPLYDDINSASVTAGTQNLIQGSGIATFRFGDTGGLRISIGGQKNDDFSTPLPPLEKGVRRGNDRRAADIAGHFRLGSQVETQFELSHSESAEPSMTPYYTQLYIKYRVDSARLAISADTDWGLLQASAYGNWFRASAVAPSKFVQAFEIYNPVIVAQLQDVVKFGTNHVVRLSAEYRHNSMGSTPVAGGTVFYDVFSGGAMWQWRIVPDLTFTNALRIDSLSLGRTGRFPSGVGLTNALWKQGSRDVFSFNSGLVWSVDDLNTVRLTAARGVELPSLVNFGLLAVSPVFGISAGVPFVKPSIVGNYELGWDTRFPDFDARLKLRAFYQTTDDLISDTGTSYPALGITYASGNIGRSHAAGLELIVSQTIDEHWKWDLGYRAEVINDHFFPGYSLLNSFRDFQDTTPVHVINAHLGWTRGPWEADGYVRFESDFDSITSLPTLTFGRLVRVPAHASLDGRIAYRVTDNLTLAISGQNLLSSTQRQTSAPAVERRVLVTASVAF